MGGSPAGAVGQRKETMMKSFPTTIIISLLLVFTLQTTKQGLFASEINPQKRLEIIGLSLLPPSGENWHHEIVHPARIEFGKLGNDKLESFIAFAVTHKLPEAESEEEFLEKISEGRWGESKEQVRFKTLLNEEKITHEKGTLCVRYHTKYEDHGSKYLSKDLPYFIVEDIGLICRHPGNRTIGVSIGISQRAKPENLLDNFNKLANDFLFNARFEPLPKNL
jgi:hypothetical protein